MGVPGLWDLLRPAATRTSLSTLAREAFYSNKNGLRALTIGIDASIWIFHAQIPQYGENPFLRTIFFKITSLLQHPVLPVFVFDGPNKPSRKRGERVAGHFGTSDYRSKQFKELLDACGLEWWNAPGEAEAELAVMSRQGKIDAVLSDDVDALLFGATCLLRNNSPTLSGTQASSTQGNAAKPGQHEMYRSSAITKHWTSREGTSLQTEEDCRMTMVWIALLGGGDYAPEGLTGFGPTITYALANAGLSSFLHTHKSGSNVDRTDAARVHSQMMEELRTNASGHLGRRYKDRATKLAEVDPSSLFPTSALDSYLRPATSPLHDTTQGWPGFGHGEAVYQKRGKARSDGRGDLVGFAKACERFFEWGTKDLVAKKFASESVGLFGSELVQCARERVRMRDPAPIVKAGKRLDGEIDRVISSPSSRITSFFQATSSSSSVRTTRKERRNSFTHLPGHVIKIHSIRKDPTNSDLNEYRISFSTTDYIQRCHDVMDGHRVDPKDLDMESRAELGLIDKEIDAPPASQAVQAKEEARVWMPEYLIREAWPELLEKYETELASRSKPKPKAKSTKSATRSRGEDTKAFKSFFMTQRPTISTQPASSGTEEEEETVEDLPPRMSPNGSSRGSFRALSTVSTQRPASNPPSSSLTPLPLSPPGMKKNARPAPTSSSSSSSTTVALPVAKTTATTHSSLNKSTAPGSMIAPTAGRRTTRQANRARTERLKSNAVEVLDMCSSDEDEGNDDEIVAIPTQTIRPASRKVLAPLNEVNSAAQTKSKSTTELEVKAKSPIKTNGKGKSRSRGPSPSKAKSKTTHTQTQTQILLGLPVIRPMRNSPAKSPVKQKKVPLFVITHEDDEKVEIDVRGRWARGQSVGAWEETDE